MSSRILPEFELLLPQSIAEAIDSLAVHGKKAAVMSGGTDLLVAMKQGGGPQVVVSLADIDGLDGLSFDPDQGLRIGARVTMNQVLESPEVKEHYRALWFAAKDNGSVQTRNVATIAGNILRASPAGDCSCAVLAHGGRVVLEGPDGRRSVSIDDFWIDYQVTARMFDELAVEVILPPPATGSCTAFAALTRTKEDLSKINAAVHLTMSGSRCAEARLAMGAVGPTLMRLPRSESLLKNKEIDDALLAEVAACVPTEIRPIDDVRSTADYRRSVSGVLVKRAILEAVNGN